jgi:hypothetical protein
MERQPWAFSSGADATWSSLMLGTSIPTGPRGRLVMRSSVCGIYNDIAVFRVPHVEPVDGRLIQIPHSDFVRIVEEGWRPEAPWPEDEA